MAIKKQHSISTDSISTAGTCGKSASNGKYTHSGTNGTNSINGHSGKHANSGIRPRITNYKQLLYDEFHRLTAQHQKAVREGAAPKELKRLMREISDTAGMLQSLSSDLDV